MRITPCSVPPTTRFRPVTVELSGWHGYRRWRQRIETGLSISGLGFSRVVRELPYLYEHFLQRLLGIRAIVQYTQTDAEKFRARRTIEAVERRPVPIEVRTISLVMSDDVI